MGVNLIRNFHNSVFAVLILSVKLICSFYCSSERCSDPFLSARALSYPEWICSWTSPTLLSHSTLRRIVSEDITSKWKVRVWSWHILCGAQLLRFQLITVTTYRFNLAVSVSITLSSYTLTALKFKTHTESLYYTTQPSLCPQNQTGSQEMRCDQLHFIRVVMHLKERHRDALFSSSLSSHSHDAFSWLYSMCLSLQIPMSLIR